MLLQKLRMGNSDPILQDSTRWEPSQIPFFCNDRYHYVTMSWLLFPRVRLLLLSPLGRSFLLPSSPFFNIVRYLLHCVLESMEVTSIFFFRSDSPSFHINLAEVVGRNTWNPPGQLFWPVVHGPSGGPWRLQKWMEVVRMEKKVKYPCYNDGMGGSIRSLTLCPPSDLFTVSLKAW